LDVGVRVEFTDRRAVKGLRSLGPDAKILSGRTRTFCLNSPGAVYRYPFDNYTIPGGVVASAEVTSANVGLLVRVRSKEDTLLRAKALLAGTSHYLESPLVERTVLGDKRNLVEQIFGAEVCSDLERFGKALEEAGLVDWGAPHAVHFPLLDWHWNVYALETTHETSKSGLMVVGDSAGHARGLLQAGISGWLAAGAVAHARD
jgi:hypothetical protein